MKKLMIFKHNKKLLYIIGILLIIFIILIYFTAQKNLKKGENDNLKFCKTNSDCIANTCCHATSCINKDKAPDCEGIFCSTVCSGPLDCGAGHCSCINNKCEIVKS